MGFHETRFPVGISWGSRGGPTFSTNIIEVDSGVEERVIRWASPRYKYDAREGVKTLDDAYEIERFFIARAGRGFGFRFKDWLDFTTASNGRSAPASTDQLLGVGDGVTTNFQLVKHYVSGPTTRTRNLRKPVSGTGLLSLNDVTQSSGFSFDYTTGIVTLTPAPAIGVAVKGGAEFDVPLRFDIDELAITMDGFESNSIPDIPMVEDVQAVAVDEEFLYGGYGQRTFGSNITIALSDGSFQDLTATAASLSATLPDPTSLPTGAPWLHLFNAGANSIAVKQSAVTLFTLAAGALGVVMLGAPAGVKTWKGVVV